ncbi:response regulator [Spirosoma aerophilum]
MINYEPEVENQGGNGSTFGFRLTFPIAEATPARTTVRLNPDALFLAVDDNPINTRILSHFIKKNGGRVAIFPSPRQTPYKAMRLDLYMPELDGYELSKKLQELQPGVPLVALSADDRSETVDRVKSSGFSFFLRKPFLPHELMHILTKLT